MLRYAGQYDVWMGRGGAQNDDIAKKSSLKMAKSEQSKTSKHLVLRVQLNSTWNLSNILWPCTDLTVLKQCSQIIDFKELVLQKSFVQHKLFFFCDFATFYTVTSFVDVCMCDAVEGRVTFSPSRMAGETNEANIESTVHITPITCLFVCNDFFINDNDDDIIECVWVYFCGDG